MYQISEYVSAYREKNGIDFYCYCARNQANLGRTADALPEYIAVPEKFHPLVRQTSFPRRLMHAFAGDNPNYRYNH